jgi:tyrosyl-tRNA synthetase
MNLLDELEARGLLADVTHRDELGQLLATSNVAHYAGYDPTGTSLHVGNLVPVILQARLQRAGHRPIIVVGGATGMVGDPSGKSAERNLLDDETLERNVAAIRAQLSRFLDFDAGPSGAILVNNADWFRGLGFLEFLRDVGKHLTINYMMAKDSVRSRLEDRESGISYTEFSYMLLQAYDFVHLAKAHGCRLQVGGSDQWGNITAGTELQHKMGRPRVYALVAPLLLDSTGQKMGKTSTGERAWLDGELMSPYAFFQYFLNTSDADVGKLLKIFSWRPLPEIAELLRAHGEDPGKRLAQRALAEEMTTWVHGAEQTTSAVNASQALFGGGGGKADVASMLAALKATGAEVPSSELPRDELAAGIPIIDLLVKTGLQPSKGAARRLLEQGGVYVNNERVTAVDLAVTTAHVAGEGVLLRAGKKSYHLVRVR